MRLCTVKRWDSFGNLSLFTACLVYCGIALVASTGAADPIGFELDSTQSYITLSIPNFTLSGNSYHVSGQNRTNGAPLSTAWSASTTTGNTAFISGSFYTELGGDLANEKVTSIQFISGSSNLYAVWSGNYRPNPAAYNVATSAYNNDGPAPANYGATLSMTPLGNAALVSFDNTTYDINSNALSASGTFALGTFLTNDPANPLNVGLLSSVVSTAGLNVFLAGQIIPNSSVPQSFSVGPDGAGGGTYRFTSASNLQLKIPINVPFQMNVDGAIVNGTETGQFVANIVPEPASILSAGLGVIVLVTLYRRRIVARAIS
jgi:hypothetical protein